MRTVTEIQKDIEIVRREIRYARIDGDDQSEYELMTDLDELQEELWNAQAGSNY
jgi:predicted RNA-binding protein with EMAP domain